MPEDQLEMHFICTVTQNITGEAPRERGNGMAEFAAHGQPLTATDAEITFTQSLFQSLLQFEKKCHFSEYLEKEAC